MCMACSVYPLVAAIVLRSFENRTLRISISIYFGVVPEACAKPKKVVGENRTVEKRVSLVSPKKRLSHFEKF